MLKPIHTAISSVSLESIRSKQKLWKRNLSTTESFLKWKKKNLRFKGKDTIHLQFLRQHPVLWDFFEDFFLAGFFFFLEYYTELSCFLMLIKQQINAQVLSPRETKSKINTNHKYINTKSKLNFKILLHNSHKTETWTKTKLIHCHFFKHYNFQFYYY